jgi:hypothetical protein
VRTLRRAASATIETTQSYQGSGSGRNGIIVIGLLQLVRQSLPDAASDLVSYC